MNDSVSIQLTNAEALVLFEYFSRWCEKDVLSFEHPAEETALLRISAQLDKALLEPLRDDYAALLDRARSEVSHGA